MTSADGHEPFKVQMGGAATKPVPNARNAALAKVFPPNHILGLPDFLLATVLGFLDGDQLASLRRTCKKFNHAACSPEFRQFLCTDRRQGDELSQVAAWQPYAHTVILSSHQLDHIQLGDLLAKLHFLRHLTIYRPERVTDEWIMSISSCAPQLIELEISPLPRWQRRAFVGLYESGPISPELDSCSISNESLAILAQRCKQLRVLKISRSSVDDDGLISLPSTLHNISIDRSGFNITDVGAAKLAQACPQLTAISLSRDYITDEGVRAIAEACPQLLVLDVSHTRVTDVGLQILGTRCSQLRRLNVRHCNITNAGVIQLTEGCPQLRALEIKHCPVGDSALVSLARGCKQLEILRCIDCVSVTDAGVAAVASACRLLRVLDVSRCNKVTDEAVLHLAQERPFLQALGVSRTACTDKLFSNVSPSIRALRANGLPISDVGLRICSERVQKLHELSLNDCDFVTDSGALRVARLCKYLRRFECNSKFLHDHGVNGLVAYGSNLEAIRIPIAISPEMIRTVVQKRPKMFVRVH